MTAFKGWDEDFSYDGLWEERGSWDSFVNVVTEILHLRDGHHIPLFLVSVCSFQRIFVYDGIWGPEVLVMSTTSGGKSSLLNRFTHNVHT